MKKDVEPYIVNETENFAVVFKPPRMHCAPLGKANGDTLLDWYAAIFPPVMTVSGRKAGEGGLLHRLDFETQGLVLFAKNNHSFSFLWALQDTGNFVKEYNAICSKPAAVHPLLEQHNFTIESFFRPFGPGRKQVRPVTDTDGKSAGTHRKEIATDKGSYYRTEIVNIVKNSHYTFTIRLQRGFRHQIRCHLAWIGCPVLHDPLYGQAVTGNVLALRATGLFFTDPVTCKQWEYRIPPLEMPVNSM